jgi:agarase
MTRRVWVATISAVLISLLPVAAQVTEELDGFGGLRGVRRAATGFFRTTRAHGRWWLVDPNGLLFFSVGVEDVSLGPRGGAGTGASTYREGALAKHGGEATWAAVTAERLRAWGFNTLGAGSDQAMRRQAMPYTISLQCAAARGGAVLGEFPDVFDPAYERAVRRYARQVCRPCASDPWLLGYFTDADLPWGTSEEGSANVLAQFLGLPDGAPGRVALLQFLERRHLNIQELNIAWRTDYASFEEIGRTPQVGSCIPQGDADAFEREFAREYMRIAHDAIRAVDKHHLILGPRFAQAVPCHTLEGMKGYVDVVCLDYRGATVPAEHLREVHRVAGLPTILIGSGWASPESRAAEPPEAEDVGETSAGPPAEYERFVRELVSLPMVVGCHWHSYADRPARDGPGSDAEPLALVDVQDEPHRESVEMATRVNEQIYELAGGPPGAGGTVGDSEHP